MRSETNAIERHEHSQANGQFYAHPSLSTGLISLVDATTKRPDPTDILFITARDVSSEAILAGAAIPVNRLSFPFRFELSVQNALANRRSDMEQALKDRDIRIFVKVCSDDSTSREAMLQTCKPSQQGQGTAKLLRLTQGMIRAPVRIILE